MSLKKEAFGVTTKGEKVTKYTLENANGMKVSLLDFGAIVQALYVPDKNGTLADVVLGFEDILGYEDNGSCVGAFVGRNANRIGGAKVTISGKEYQLEKNDGENNLHGGMPGFHRVMYEMEYFEEEGSQSIEFSRLSPHMEQGFPGNLDVTVTYTLTEDNEFAIEYHAVSDQDTIVNLTNHSYFNLKGHASGDAGKHMVQILADEFVPTNKELIPDGTILPVKNTPMDFNVMKPVEQDIEADYQPIIFAGGYDHNYVLHTTEDELAKVCEVYEPESGRAMEVFTDLPGMQFYAANFLAEPKYGKEGKVYGKRDGLCFETQFFPNACNVPNFKSSLLKAGQEFESATIYRFFNK